jgi:hypothetical protein
MAGAMPDLSSSLISNSCGIGSPQTTTVTFQSCFGSPLFTHKERVLLGVNLEGDAHA